MGEEKEAHQGESREPGESHTLRLVRGSMGGTRWLDRAPAAHVPEQGQERGDLGVVIENSARCLRSSPPSPPSTPLQVVALWTSEMSSQLGHGCTISWVFFLVQILVPQVLPFTCIPCDCGAEGSSKDTLKPRVWTKTMRPLREALPWPVTWGY